MILDPPRVVSFGHLGHFELLFYGMLLGYAVPVLIFSAYASIKEFADLMILRRAYKRAKKNAN